jgi:hypothetical protein
MMGYTCLISPYRIAFVEEDDSFWQVVDWIVTGAFGLDVLINFFSAYADENENLITNHCVIPNNATSKMYLEHRLALPQNLVSHRLYLNRPI